MSGTATYMLFVWILITEGALSFDDYNTEPGLKAVEATMPAEDIVFHGDQNLCPQRTFCTIISECRLLMDIMDRSCLVPSRLKELICGYHKTEAMVCCPYGGNLSPFTPNQFGGGHAIQKNVSESNKLNQNCGRPHLNGWRNGYSGIGSQPWVARIGFKGEKMESVNYPCCGSIVTNKVILTAAHCALAEPPGYSLHSVRVGDYDGRTDPDCTKSFCAHPVQDIEISRVVVHPGYEKGEFRHDVALLILKTPVTYSVPVSFAPVRPRQSELRPHPRVRWEWVGTAGSADTGVISIGSDDSFAVPFPLFPFASDPLQTLRTHLEIARNVSTNRRLPGPDASYPVAVQPICLLQNPNVGLVGRKGKLIGWGKLAGQDAAPRKEQQIELPVIPLEHCSKIYGRVIPIASSHLCIGGEAKKDACSGFGGAPFVLLDHLTRDRYYQAGMLSFGSDKCGSAGIPSVYTRIQHYYDWINANVPD